MIPLVLLRHGESVWNKENRFTGWTDVDITEKGIREARTAGKLLSESGYSFDIAFSSYLKKAIRTLWLVLDEMDLMWIPVKKSWRLNERHYGALQGLYKSDTARQYGEQQVLLWRRSYDVQPPPVDRTDERYPGNDPRYQHLSEAELPLTESLKDTYQRLLPYWKGSIAPEIQAGKQVLIVAHGNTLRSLVKHLENLSNEEVVKLNIPTGIPLLYQLDEELHPIQRHYLGDPEMIHQAISSVENQGKVNSSPG